jgi:hypothetical protein
MDPVSLSPPALCTYRARPWPAHLRSSLGVTTLKKPAARASACQATRSTSRLCSASARYLRAAASGAAAHR